MVTSRLAQWWEPQAPETRVAGTLDETEPGLFLLHLDGHFGSPDDEATAEEGKPRPTSFPMDDFPMLLGTTREGKRITLIDCRVLRAGGFPGVTKTFQDVRPRLIAWDVHFPSPDDFRLNSLSLRYSNLDLWVATSGFSINYHHEPGFGVSVKYQKPAAVEARLSNGLAVGIAFSASGPELRRPQTEMRIEQKAWLNVSALDERPHEDLLRTATMVADLIALGIGKPLRLTESEATALEIASETKPKRSIRFPLHHNSEPIAPSNSADVTEVLFSLKDIRDRFETVLEAWCGQPEALTPLYRLYFGTLRSPSMYVEHRFLNMFQALEAFHRRIHVASEESARKHEERRKRIDTAVEKRDRKWLEGRLRYSHEPAAVDRIRLLVGQYDAHWIFDDVKREIQLAGNFRNFHTHYDLKLEDKLPPVQDRRAAMHNLAVRLQLLCEVILLRHAGFESEVLKERILKCRRLERRLVRF